MKLVSLSLSLFCMFSLAIGCSSKNKNPKARVPKPQLSDAEYEKLIFKFTQRDERYDGFQNLFNVKATLLNSKVNVAKVDRIRYYMQMDGQEALSLREKNFQEMSSESQMFISFFSPDKNIKKLDKTSFWKFYLEHDGRRYEGKVSRYLQRDFEMSTLFPYMDRWSKAYIVKFEVPMNSIENTPTKVIMTSSAGRSEFNFPSVSGESE